MKSSKITFFFFDTGTLWEVDSDRVLFLAMTGSQEIRAPRSGSQVIRVIKTRSPVTRIMRSRSQMIREQDVLRQWEELDEEPSVQSKDRRNSINFF